MKKFSQILSLVALAIAFTGCSFGDSPIADRNQSFVSGAQSEFETDRGECAHYGTVRKVRGQLSCDYLIILDSGRLLSPTNVEEIPFDLENGQRVYFGFNELFPGDRGCLEAPYVRINCITRIDRDHEANTGNDRIAD